jgi:hypothetical protein
MSNKYLTLAGLKAAVAKSEAKDLVDSPLGEALKWLDYAKEDERGVRRGRLDQVIQAVPAAKKKAAADRAVVKYLDDVLRAATTERKNIDAYLAKFGLRKVRLQVNMTNWDGDVMGDRQVFLTFKCPGAPDIQLSKKVFGGILQFNDVELPPRGSIFVEVGSRTGRDEFARDTETYDLPKKPLVLLKIKQEHEEIKKKAKSGLKAAEKAGQKGTVGINWKIFSAGKEITSEKEISKEYEEEVEYTIKLPKGSLVIGKTE